MNKTVKMEVMKRTVRLHVMPSSSHARMAIVLWILGNAMVKMIVPMEVTKRNLYAKKGSALPVNSGLYSVELQFFFSTKILS